MRLIKLGLISLVFLFLAATAISLLIPSHIRISRAINIRGDKKEIFSLIRDTLQWHQWHPAFMPSDTVRRFPAMQVTLRTQNDSELVMDMQQGNKPTVVNGWKLYEYQNLDSITLQWYMDFHIKWYPWQKFGSLFYENTYGVMMEQGLSNIKNLTDK